jgi:hypothetical protein
MYVCIKIAPKIPTSQNPIFDCSHPRILLLIVSPSSFYVLPILFSPHFTSGTYSLHPLFFPSFQSASFPLSSFSLALPSSFSFVVPPLQPPIAIFPFSLLSDLPHLLPLFLSFFFSIRSLLYLHSSLYNFRPPSFPLLFSGSSPSNLSLPSSCLPFPFYPASF